MIDRTTYQNVPFQATPPEQAHLRQSVPDIYQDGDEP